MIMAAINRIEQLDTLENIALSCHVPCDATYVIVDNNFNYKVISRERFSFNSKYIVMDFYSKLIDLNKAVDRKKIITSNNYLTFFYKYKNINRFNDSVIDNYYCNLKTPDDKLMYKNWIKKNMAKFLSKTPNGFIKIFFVTDINEYINLGRKYLRENILSNVINKNIQGTSLFINLNAKKPYLKNRTRKESKPQLIAIEEAIKYKYFNDILTSLALRGYNIVYVLENGRVIAINSKGSIPEMKFLDGIIIVYKLNNKGKLILLDIDVISRYDSAL